MNANPVRQLYESRFRKWPTTQATVESCTWVSGHDNLGCEAGHYDVSFAYQVNPSGKAYHGSFCYEGCKDVTPYLKSESIAVQYKPTDPERFKMPNADSNYEKIEAIFVMALFALAAGYVLAVY